MKVVRLKRRSEGVAFLKHVKERRRLLEEEIKKEGGLGKKNSPRILDANGKPVKSSIPLVDATGKPLADELSNMHMNEDIDAVMKSRLDVTPKEKSAAKKAAEHKMRSASEAMLNVYDAKEGDTIEICPEACMLMQEITQWLDETTGCRG